MACIQHVVFLLTAMSTYPWSHGVASEISQYERQNQSQDYYDLREIYKVVFRSGNESDRINQRSVLERNSEARGAQDTTSSDFFNQSGQLQEPSSKDKVVFPGPTATYYRRLELEIPESCKKVGICEAVPNYPDEQVTKIVTELGDKKKFQVDELDIPETPDIAQRLGPQEDNMELCSFREQVRYPEALPDNKGKWHLVINPKSKPVQGIRVEICEKTQSPCADFVSFQSGYEAQCIQKYAYRHIQTLDANGVMVEMPLKVPSCCSCVAKLIIR